jgi:transposase
MQPHMSVATADDAQTGEIEALRARVRELQAQRDEQAARAEQQAARAEQLAEHARQLEYQRDRLKQQIRRLAYLVYGRRSEKLSREQMGQLALSFGASDEQAAVADPLVPQPAATATALEADQPGVGSPQPSHPQPTAPKSGKHPGRTRLSPALERVITQVRVPEGERACSGCGHPMAAFRTVEHERVEYVPEKLLVHVEQREVLGCTHCRGEVRSAPRCAPAPVRRVGPSLLAALIENKCDDALPIHRQRDRFARLGFDVPVNTLYSYFAYASDLLVPVAAVTLSTVLGQQPYVQVDDTTLKVLDKHHPKGRSLGHLWCFVGPGPLVGYTFTATWQAEAIAPFIGAIEGAIQCDDYKGYSSELQTADGERFILVPPERRLGCLMHVRRRFHAAWQLGEKRAAVPLQCIREIYALEALAKEQALDSAQRCALRQQHSLAWLDRFDAWVDANQPLLAPRSKLGQALGYAVHQRPFIRRCFSDGRFELDNGQVERTIREPAIGRRNFLFTGSLDAAQRLASAYTLVQSCRALRISTREYLIDVIAKLEAGWLLRRIGELVPDRWARERGLLPLS